MLFQVAKLSSILVASEHSLASFEEYEGEFDGDVQVQMAQMENVAEERLAQPQLQAPEASKSKRRLITPVQSMHYHLGRAFCGTAAG